jgi:crossover junction endodeoxyribonuclease RuvC
LKDKISSGAPRKIILGIDPGLARMGYGVIVQQSGRLKALDYGTITSAAHTPIAERLVLLFDQIRKVLKKHKPDAVALEEVFFSKNVKTGIVVSQARGVAVLAAGLAGLPVYEYRPVEVKQAVTGYGQAQKEQVQRMVKLLLGLSEVPKPDDTADALAVALTHAQIGGGALARMIQENRK